MLFPLIIVMLTLAAIPSASVALVVTRSATLGYKNGVAVAAGIVCGDLVFVVLAIMGLTVLAKTMGSLFAVFRYAGGAYLIWIGVGLLRSSALSVPEAVGKKSSKLAASFLAGLFLTLGDVKAILFYASLFPAFFDFGSFGTWDVVIIIAVTIVSVGGVKMLYAWKIVSRMQSYSSRNRTKNVAGGVLVGAGAYVVAKT